MPSEAEKRKPGFTPGVPIVLSDGQAWEFPRPTVAITEFIPTFGPDGAIGAGARRRFGGDYDAKLEAFQAAGGGVAELTALFALAVDLLGRNYDLTPAEYQRILVFRPGDETNRETWQAIANVAQGDDGPKPSPVGDGPA